MPLPKLMVVMEYKLLLSGKKQGINYERRGNTRKIQMILLRNENDQHSANIIGNV